MQLLTTTTDRRAAAVP